MSDGGTTHEERPARQQELIDEVTVPKHALAEDLLDKIRELPPDKIVEVEDFVDFLRMKSDDLLAKHAVTKLSEKVFEKVWDNDDDAEYDKL